jgi:peptidoglycan/LPS O-acetylase OafA/YrhL
LQTHSIFQRFNGFRPEVSDLIQLRRVTNSRAFIPEIDGLRFVAILSVVLLHIRSSLTHNGAIPNSLGPAVAESAKRGVELFFVISGFILALPFFRSIRENGKMPSLKDYYLRRVTRLEPPYALSLVIGSVALIVTKTATVGSLWPHFLASLVYGHGLIYRSVNPISFVIWSLEVEVQFYLLVPLLTRIFGLKSRRLLLVAAIASSMVLSTCLRGTVFDATVLGFLPFFLGGFLLCELYLDSPEAWRTGHVGWDVASLLLWPAVWLMPETIELCVLPAVLIVVFLGAFNGIVTSRFFRLRWVTDIGGMCYSIYLLHVLILSATTRVTKPLHFGDNFAAYYLLQAMIVLPVILLGCGVFFVLVERPCMDRDWPRRLWRRLSTR